MVPVTVFSGARDKHRDAFFCSKWGKTFCCTFVASRLVCRPTDSGFHAAIGIDGAWLIFIPPMKYTLHNQCSIRLIVGIDNSRTKMPDNSSLRNCSNSSLSELEEKRVSIWNHADVLVNRHRECLCLASPKEKFANCAHVASWWSSKCRSLYKARARR